jgi:carboxylesterase type B
MDKDYLFLDVYAPTNATTDSNLPGMVFIQGGGWSSVSNGNFNGSLLVENSGMNMIVVTLNYRVGLLGALASKDVLDGGSLNSRLKDGQFLFIRSNFCANTKLQVMFVLQWVQDRVDLVCLFASAYRFSLTDS